MKVEDITLSQSNINRVTIDMFLYLSGSEGYFSESDMDILMNIDVATWKNVKKVNNNEMTMLNIADFILDCADLVKK